MKKYSLILILLTFAVTGSFAQRPVAGGSIQLVSQRTDVLQVEISGLQLFKESMTGGLLLCNLLPGEYRMKVSATQRSRRNMGYIVDQNLRVQPGQRIIVSIAANNRVTISYAPEPNSIMLCVDGRDRHEPQPPMVHAISDDNLNRMLVELKRYAFDDDKQNMLDASALHHFYLSEQLGKIMTTFRSDESRLKCAKTLLPHVLDPENLYLQANVFTFNSGRDAYLNLIRPR